MDYLQLIPDIYIYMVYIWYGLKKQLLNLDYSTFVFCPYGARAFPPTIIRTGWRPRLVPLQVTEKVDADRSETMVVNGYTMMRILMVYILMVIENAVMSSYSWLFMAISGYQWLFMVMNVTCTLGSWWFIMASNGDEWIVSQIITA